jgi:hypothetical protein
MEEASRIDDCTLKLSVRRQLLATLQQNKMTYKGRTFDWSAAPPFGSAVVQGTTIQLSKNTGNLVQGGGVPYPDGGERRGAEEQ